MHIAVGNLLSSSAHSLEKQSRIELEALGRSTGQHWSQDSGYVPWRGWPEAGEAL